MRTIAHPLALALVLTAAFAAAPAPAAEKSPSPKASARAQDRIAPGIVDAAQARQLVADGVKAVDVRTPNEFAAGHVPGAVNIPHDQIAARAGELGPATMPLLLYCHSGRRSGIAVAALREKGFTRLYDLQAYERWIASEPKAP